MHYFTKEEAYNICKKFEVLKGQQMKFSPENETSNVVDITVLKTPYEIAIYGEIEDAYSVLITFENHPGLQANLFCIFNNLPPMYAGREALNQGMKNQLVSNKAMYGKWELKDGENVWSLQINEEVIMEVLFNGIKENTKFRMSGHWFTYYAFFFSADPGYIIKFANQNELGLAKLATPGTIDGNFVWDVKLKRIIS